MTARGSSSGSSKKSGGESSSYSAISAKGREIIASNILPEIYAGGWETSGQYAQTTSSYAAYISQLNQSNEGILGDKAVRDYLNKQGITDKYEQSRIMEASGVPAGKW